MTWPSCPRPRRRPDRALALVGTIAAVAVPSALAAPAAPEPPAAPEAPAAAPGDGEQPLMTLRRGDVGAAVEDLQRALAGRGADLVADGEFGPRTEAAVRAEQEGLGQEPTGVADPAFLTALGLDLREPPPPPVCTPDGATSAPDAPAGRRLRVFPVVGEYRYSSSFGDARHQGAHEGVDIMADRGTPVLAVTDAVVHRLSRQETGLGGIWVWLREPDGTEYYYAHLDAIVDGLAEGDRVPAGAHIGAVGNTGDARYGAHHLHFEMHPRGGRAADPYPELRAVDPGSGTRSLADGGCVAPARPATGSSRGAAVSLSVRQLRINQRIAQTAVRRVNRLSARLTGSRAPEGGGRGDGRITLSRRQLLINQRISQAALVRAKDVEAALEGRSAGEGPADRQGDAVTLSRRQLVINQRVSQAAVRKANALRVKVADAAGARAAAAG